MKASNYEAFIFLWSSTSPTGQLQTLAIMESAYMGIEWRQFGRFAGKVDIGRKLWTL